MMPKFKTLLLMAALYLGGAIGSPRVFAGGFVFLDPLLTYCHKESIVLTMGRYQDRLALRITAGQGPGTRMVGLVYKEAIPTSGEAMSKELAPAIDKLARVLNAQDLERLDFDSLSSDIGLTYEKLVPANEIVIGGPAPTASEGVAADAPTESAQ